MKLQFLGLLAAASFSVGAPALAQDGWPQRPITIIAPAGAGGGTDSVARLLANGLQNELGQPVNVVNQGQGGGVVGFTTITDADPDGYTLGLIYNFAHYKPMGLGDFDAAKLTPIAQVNFDPAGFQVPTNSPWQDISSALGDIKADPGKYNIACGGGCGGSWPIALATLLKESDVDLSKVHMISGPGAAEALQEMVAGGYDVVPCSIPEAGSLLEAKLVRSLAVFGTERLKAYPDIPTLAEETGMNLELGAWRGVVGPEGLPEDVTAKLTAAVKAVYDSAEFQEAMASRGFGLRWRDAAEFGEFMTSEENSVRPLLKDLGI